jgi:predicted dehydrogenase
MSNQVVRIGFVGCGSMSTSALYPSLRGVPELKPVATCDLRRELAERNARLFGFDRWYTDLDEMLNKESLDAAFVVGPPQMHVEVGVRCLESGLHIYVEKPPAVSSSEAMKLVEASKKSGKHVQVGFQKRHAPAYIQAKQLVDSTSFGRVIHYQARFSSGPYDRIWGLESPEYSCLVGNCCHHFDLARYFMGDIKEVHAREAKISDTKYAISIVAEFTSGAQGIFNFNTCERWTSEITDYPRWSIPERVQITGDGNYVIVDNVHKVGHYPENLIDPTYVQTFGYGGSSWTQPSQYAEVGTNPPSLLNIYGYYGEVQHFGKMLAAGKEPQANIVDGLKSVLLAESVWESIRTGKTVQIFNIRN